METENIKEILDFDPLCDSYKTDKDVASLGLFLHCLYNKQKK